MAQGFFSRIFRPSPETVQQVTANQVSAWSESSLYSDGIPKYNPDELIGRKSCKIYRKMMTDEQVKAVVRFKRDAITSRDWYFTLDDDRLSDAERDMRIDIYTEMLNQVSGTFNDGLNYIMMCEWQGFSITEKLIGTFDYRGVPYLGLRRLKPKPFDTFKFYTDEYGEITRFRQELDGREQDLDLGDFVYMVANPEMDEHYGQSELREAHRSFYSKEIIIRMYNIFLERYASGFPVLRPDPVNGPDIIAGSPLYSQLTAILDHLQVQTGVLLPKGIMLEMIQAKSTDQYEKAIVFHDLQIAKALLVPNLLGISHTGQTGSYSQSQTQLEAFLWTLDNDAGRLVDTVNEQIFNPLSRDNFADGIGPKFRLKPISDEMKMKLIERWTALVTGKAVEATDTDEAHLRDLLDFPEKGEPLEVNSPPEPQNNPPPVNNGEPDEQLPDETLNGALASITSSAGFDRAKRRVAVKVIDRGTEQIVDRQSEDVAGKVADLVAEASLRIIDQNLGTPNAEQQPHQFTLDSAAMLKVRRAFTKALKQGWDLGLKHARTEIETARGELFNINMARIDTNATEFLESNGFRLTGDLTDDMLKSIRAILANAVKYGWTPRETVRKVYDRLTLAGMVFSDVNAEVTGRTVAEVLEAIGTSQGKEIYRIKTAIRTALFESLNEARFSAFTDPDLGDFVEALEYSAILDSRTTDICKHLDDRVYPVDSPFWNSHRPPNHFNCRSILVPVTVIDTEVEGKDAETGSRWSRPPRIEPQSGFG